MHLYFYVNGDIYMRIKMEKLPVIFSYYSGKEIKMYILENLLNKISSYFSR